MKSVIGIYQTHQGADDAVYELQKAGYPTKQISLLGKADMVDDHIALPTSDATPNTELGVGAVAGTALGILTGAGIMALPGLGFLYGAGALMGAFAGFDLGVIGGGMAAILTSMGLTRVMSESYEKHLMEGKFLVVVQGSDEELDNAQHILHMSSLHMELDRN
jgi:hypothetical protein